MTVDPPLVSDSSQTCPSGGIEVGVLRRLVDPPLDGPTNMARDEALLELVSAGRSPPTLRLYQWSPPTISLGYFQPYADYEALAPPARGLAVVRRLTGGGAILHDQELTYSLTLPSGHPLLAAGPNCLYALVHRAVIVAIARSGVTATRCGVTDDCGPRRGPFFCFARRHEHDVLVGHDKLAGSAQRRTRRGVLQHGSIVLSVRYAQQPAAQLPAAVDAAELGHSFDQALAEEAHLVYVDGPWSDSEEALAAELVTKYAGAEWTRRV